jgi:two-component system cell cycle response regulator
MGFRATFLFADLDGFKNVNDTLGHEEGDEVLRETASIFRETFRVSDIPGRIGGDEFAVLMLHDGEDQPGNAVERLVEAIRRANGRRTREYSLSMSLGLSEWNPGSRLPSP